MSEGKDQESMIYIRVSRELKGRWVALSRKEEMKLTDWIVTSVGKAISEVEAASSADRKSEHI